MNQYQQQQYKMDSIPMPQLGGVGQTSSPDNNKLQLSTMPQIGQVPMPQFGQQQQQQPSSAGGFYPNQQQQQQPSTQQNTPYQQQQSAPQQQQQQPQQQYQVGAAQQQQVNGQQPLPPMPSYPSYITNTLANQSAQQMTATGKTVVDDMEDPVMKYEDALGKERKAELLSDYEEVRNMTLLDNDDMLYNLMLNSGAFVMPNFKATLISSYYKTKYPELFDKYPSLSVYLEFVISKIVYGSEAKLKSSCASRIIRLPNSRGNDGFLKMFGCRKRGSNAAASIAKKSKTIKHPFLTSQAYNSQPTLYSIGKCCEYLVPSEFTELFAHVQHENISRMLSLTSKTTVKGLKITLSKPIVCILVSKSVSTYTFISLEHLSGIGDTLARMTSLGKLDDTFAFGTKQAMQVETINTERIEQCKQGDRFDDKIYAVVITGMQVCKLSNKTLSSKTYSNLIFSIPDNKLSDDEMTACQQYIDRVAPDVEKTMDIYDAEVLELAKLEAAVHNIGPAGSVGDDSNAATMEATITTESLASTPKSVEYVESIPSDNDSESI